MCHVTYNYKVTQPFAQAFSIFGRALPTFVPSSSAAAAAVQEEAQPAFPLFETGGEIKQRRQQQPLYNYLAHREE